MKQISLYVVTQGCYGEHSDNINICVNKEDAELLVEHLNKRYKNQCESRYEEIKTWRSGGNDCLCSLCIIEKKMVEDLYQIKIKGEK